MYDERWLVFIAKKNGKQTFHVCPFILSGFWNAFAKDMKDHNNAPSWTETVPPKLRSKIKVYNGSFLNFNDLKGTELAGESTVVLAGPYSGRIEFNPSVWVKQMLTSLQEQPMTAVSMGFQLRVKD